MPILHKCEQYSDEYDRLKLGIPTSSNFKKIISPQGKPSTSWKKYAYHLIAERLLDRQVDSYTSPYMERGLALESDAAEFYEMLRNRPLEKIGFITNDDKTVGCSPDRLIGDDGLLEIKVPAPQTQIEYLLTGQIDREYWPQLQGQLFVSQREFVDIISYHPELPPSIIRVERDDVFIACLESLLWEFNSFLKEVMAKITTMQNQKGPSNVAAQIQF
jgi:hypothetical protein